jgi:RNA polymerase sigma-70 factor (ECF subfamily)
MDNSTPALNAVVARPEADFASVYEAHVGFVFAVLLRLGVRRADAEDVCQEVFVTVHRKLPRFEGRSSLRTWIYGIAYRAASEYRRRADVRREQPTAEVDLGAAEAQQLHTMERRQAREVLGTILDALDDDKRAVFVLYELEGLSMAEVAAVVGCPLQTAYSRLHAGRRHVERAAERLDAREVPR